MAKEKRISCGLLLLTAILTLTMAMLPEQAFARYYAGASWNAVINDQSQTIPILSKKSTTLEISVSSDQFQIEKMQSDGTFSVYSGDGLTTSYADGTVTITLGETLPPAGTYRLAINMTDEGTETVTFFINYSGS